MTDVREEAVPRAAGGSGERDVFVSYSRADLARAQDLVQRLEAAGRSVWVDWSGIPPTAEWMAEVESGIDACAGVLVLMSAGSIASEVCGREVAHAMASGKRVVPVALEDVDAAAVPEPLARLNWVFARPSDDLDLATQRIGEGLDLDLDRVRTHTRILVRSKEWQASGEDGSRLLRGQELEDAERWLASAGDDPRPTAGQRAFVAASRAASTRRQRRTLAVVASVAAASLVLAGFALVQRNAAEASSARAQTQAASAVAVTELDHDPELSLLLALEAARTGRTPQSDDALRRAIAASHVDHVLRPTIEGSKSTPMVAAAYTDDGTRLVTAGNDDRTLVWDAATGALLATITGPNESRMLSAVPGTSLVVSFDQSGHAQVVDAAAGTLGPKVELPAPALSVERGREPGTVVVSTYADVRTLDARTGRLGDAVAPPAAPSNDATWSPDGRTLALASFDGAVHLLRDGAAPVEVRRGSGMPYVARWSGDGTRIVVCWTDNAVTIVDAVTGAITATLPHDASPTDATWVGGRALVVTGDSAGVARVWDAGSGRMVAVLRGHTDYIPFVATSRDGTHIATMSYDNTGRTWRLDDSVPTSMLRAPRPVVGAAVLPDDRSAVVSRSDGKVELVDLASMTALRTLDTAAPGVPAVSADGRLAAVVAVEPRPEVRVVDVATGRVLMRTDDTGERADPQSAGTLPGRVYSVAFSPDGRQLALAASGSVRVIDVATGRTVASQLLASDLNVADLDIQKDGVLPRRTVAWTADGALVAVTSSTGARLWDPVSGKVVRWYEGHTGTAQGLALDAAGTRLVTTSVDKTARVYDLRTGALLAVLRGHTAEVLTAAFSPSGDRIVTSGLDGTVRVWGVDGTPLATYPVATIVASSARFLGAEDRLLVTTEEGANFTQDPVPAVQSGALELRECVPCRPRDDLLALAHSRVTRSLTPAELALVTAQATSTASPSPVPTITSPLVGIWQSDVVVGASRPGATRTVELHPDGRYLAFDVGGFGEGTFTVEGASVRFDGFTFDCPGSDGSYAWAQQGVSIVLTPAAPRNDQCQPTVLRP